MNNYFFIILISPLSVLLQITVPIPLLLVSIFLMIHRSYYLNFDANSYSMNCACFFRVTFGDLFGVCLSHCTI